MCMEAGRWLFLFWLKLKGCYVSVYAQLFTVQDFRVHGHRVIIKLHEKILDIVGKHKKMVLN